MRSQLTWLVLVLVAVPLGLTAIGATPVVPGGAPDLGTVGATLRGSDLPISAIGYAIVDVAWVVWAWLTLSLLLRVVLNLAEAAARGAEWVRSLRAVSDALTLPLVRRAVDGALAAVVVANVALRAVPVAAAEPLAATAPAAVVASVEQPVANAIPDKQRGPTQALHLVKPGESLWSIAEQYYGSGRDYPRLVEANVGQTMSNGQVFPKSGVIQPGWSLRVPLASSNIETVNGEYFYTVEPGDTLWGISGRLLGDETRWPELFDANRDIAQLEDGRVLRDPNLIWPTLRLRLPPPLAVEPESSSGAVAAEPAEATSQPAPSRDATPLPTTPLPEPSDGTAVATALGASAAALAVVASGGALMQVRSRGRHELLELPLSSDPQGDIPIRGGFAETDPSRDLAQDQPPHPAMMLTSHIQRAVAEHGARIVLLRYGRSHSSVTLRVPTGAVSEVRGLAPVLGRRLGTQVQARAADGDIVFDIATPSAHLSSAELTAPELLLACVLTDRSELWLDPKEAGHLLVTSLPGGGADQVAASLVAASAARRAPHELKVWTIAAPDELPPVLDGLPQHVKPRASSRNGLEIEATLRDVRAELMRRMQGPSQAEPDILLVLGELACLDYAAQRTTLDMLGSYGPAHGVRLIAASRDTSNIPDELIKLFNTRLVMRTATTDDSQRLLGGGDAVDLLGGGQLWMRVGSRRPLEGYGIRSRPDLLDRFVRLLRARHGMPPFSATPDASHDAAPRPKLVQLDDVDAPADTSALIHVRCFGGFDVRGPGGELIPTVDELTSDRGWDLLARLAAAPEGAVAGAQLLDELWPGADYATAERQLRSAAASLRRMLERVAPGLHGEVVRVAPGDICHLDTRLVVSDVHRFLRLCRAAPQMPSDQARLAWQRARGLYRGALLDGPGARAWAWATNAELETSRLSLRERYREHAYHATRGLARLAAADGHLDEAIGYYRELLSVEPTLEDVVRELCKCYLQIGDLAAVRDQEHRLNQALQAAYMAAGPNEDPMAYEPEAATVALFDRARREAPAAAAVAD